jgi:transglutaminase-like putative cysteine protease
MEKSSTSSHWWDWHAVILLFLLLQTLASRLVTTTWTPFLFIIQTVTSMGFVIGLTSGYTIFSRRTARWLSFLYLVILLPLQWTLVIDQEVSLEEQLASVAGRLLFSIVEFFSRRPVEDPLFFVAIMSVTFWIISASAGFYLARNQNFLVVVLPSAIGLLVIQNYDNAVPGRLWFIAFFAFAALFLLGRLNFLRDQKRWRETRVFLSPENSIDITSGMAIAAGLIILVAWNIPHSISSIDSARRAWERLTRPWNEFTESMENAVSALDSPSGGRPGEFYGTELDLGRGFPLSESVMFEVQVPNLPSGERPPRYYWRGRTYDYFANDLWYITGTTREEFSPVTAGPPIADTIGQIPKRFLFKTGESKFSLIYSPAQPVWVSRPATYLTSPANGEDNDIVTWNVSTTLLPGETYQVDAVLKNPNIEQLREAGTNYPEWVTEKYLQLPPDFSSRIGELAVEVTASAETPYDKAIAVTSYLRVNIEYAPTVPQVPRNRDPLEWILFEHKQAYCVYYASAEILMLRSLGIPARMAVGFAQGEGFTGGDGFADMQEGFSPNTYTVRKLNAHAWPEVYFPDIGWVEFEPTGNQPILTRPSAPQSLTNNLVPDPRDALDFLDRREIIPGEDDAIPAETTIPVLASEQTVMSVLYLLPLFIALAALTIFLSRRYAVPARIPSLLRTSIERSGVQTPDWVYHWERWVSLSSIEKSFESINFGLRLLKQPAPIHATPIERAKALTEILPAIEPRVNTLLDEHQTSLYTSRTADAAQARRAAFQIRIQILLAMVRYFWTGTYSPQT